MAKSGTVDDAEAADPDEVIELDPIQLPKEGPDRDIDLGEMEREPADSFIKWLIFRASPTE